MSSAAKPSESRDLPHGGRAPRPLRKSPLLELVERIVTDGDHLALAELHNNRAMFRAANQGALRLVEFLDRIHQSNLAREWCGRDAAALDKALDLCLDKFSNIPRVESLKRNGPDCRYYFAAFLKKVNRELEAKGQVGVIETERIATSTLQRHIFYHFMLSCKEARRQANPAVRRYAWSLNGHTMQLWMPRRLDGPSCAAWLEANVTPVDPARPGERDRIQMLIDERLGRPCLVPLNPNAASDHRWYLESLPWASAHEVSVKGLISAIADEKVRNLHRQRPAIRRLGEQALRRLVLAIFDAIQGGRTNAAEIARRFGLNKVTFGRFVKFHGELDLNKDIPDLWANLAQTLAANPCFVEVAKAAGVWGRVQAVLQRGGQGEGIHDA